MPVILISVLDKPGHCFKRCGLPIGTASTGLPSISLYISSASSNLANVSGSLPEENVVNLINPNQDKDCVFYGSDVKGDRKEVQYSKE